MSEENITSIAVSTAMVLIVLIITIGVLIYQKGNKHGK